MLLFLTLKENIKFKNDALKSSKLSREKQAAGPSMSDASGDSNSGQNNSDEILKLSDFGPSTNM